MADYSVILVAVLCMTIIKGDDPLCNDQLVKGLPDDHLSSSDNKAGTGTYTGPERGRLNTTEVKSSNGTILEGAWSPAADSQNTYIQAMFDDVTMVNSILTQGRNQGNDHVTTYTVQYTEDGTTWKTVNNQALGVEEIFKGNSDSDTIQENELSCPIFAKGIRIVPKEWSNHIALRFDVKGCNIDDSAAVMTTPGNQASIITTVSAMNATSPTFLPGILTPFGLTTTTQATTVNLQTLIQWFKTALSNSTSTTTPLTTPSTTSTTLKTTTTTTKPTVATTRQTTLVTTPVKTTAPYIFHPGIPSVLLPSPTPGNTPVTTYPPPFMPGILNPFGTTQRNPWNPGSGLIG